MAGYTIADRARNAQALSPTGVRRGDLVVTVTTSSYTFTTRTEQRTDAEVGVAVSVTREGRVKVVRHAWQGDDQPGQRVELICGLKQILTVPASKIDVAAALRTAREHTWKGDRTAKPYGSLDEVREALRPHLIGD